MKNEDFQRLIYNLNNQDNRCTANPIFIVQQEYMVIGIDLSYADDRIWTNDEEELYFENLDDVFNHVNENIYDGYCDYDNFIKYPIDYGFTKTGYRKEWRYVCAHFTEESASRWISENSNRYDNLRVYVDSQFRCWEFNDVLNAIRDGELKKVDE